MSSRQILIYQWIVGKYGGLFKNMPCRDMHLSCGYSCVPCSGRIMTGKTAECSMHVRHMDMEVGGRIWYSEASLEVDASGTGAAEGLQRLCGAGTRAYGTGFGYDLFQLPGVL